MQDSEPLSAVEALTRLGGISGTGAVVELSSRTRVRTAIKRGDLVRVGRNRLALPDGERGLAAARAVNGFASHVTAALHHGWKVKFPPDLPQVTVQRRQDVPADPGVLVELFQRDVPRNERAGWATSKLRTVIDCARDLPFDDALCVADSALRAGDVTSADLVTAAAKVTGPGAERVRLVAAYANGKAANPLLGVALEADSYEFHGREPKDHNNDCFRYNELVVAGWDVLRFTWDQVMHSPDYVVRTIRALLTEHAQAA